MKPVRSCAAAARSRSSSWLSRARVFCPAVVGAVGGAAWYLSRLARGTEVVWDKKNNPHPWQHVKENQQVKLFAVNHKYDGEPSVFPLPTIQ